MKYKVVVVLVFMLFGGFLVYSLSCGTGDTNDEKTKNCADDDCGDDTYYNDDDALSDDDSSSSTPPFIGHGTENGADCLSCHTDAHQDLYTNDQCLQCHKYNE